MGCCKSKFQQTETDFRDDYVLGRRLGQGSFGVVHECSHIKTSKTFAVKIMEHDTSWVNELFQTSVKFDIFLSELKVLQSLDHRHVIKIHDVFVDKIFCYVVLDKFESDLIAALGALKKAGREMTQEILVRIFEHMMKAVEYLHSKLIIHRDVKADNYLVDCEGFCRPDFRVVLTDLGTACVLPVDKLLTEQVGTRKYWAPEVILRKYAHPVDVWAVGVTLYGFLTGKFPFVDPNAVMTDKLSIPKSLDEEVRQVLKGLLEKNWNKRTTPSEALKFPWLKKVQGTSSFTLDLDSMLAAFNKKVDIPKEVRERRQKALADIESDFKKGIRHGKKIEEMVATKRHSLDGSEAATTANRTFLTEDSNGNVHTWEWWDKEKCLQNGIAEAAEAQPSKSSQTSILANLAEVKLPWTANGIQDILREHNIDLSKFGQGSAKTITQFTQELLRGECYFMEGKDRLYRVLDVVVVRLRAGQNGASVVVETKQKFADGRERPRNLLPGAMRRPHEDISATAKRVISDELMLPKEAVRLNVGADEHLDEEAESPSYPGITSIYQKHFVDAYLTTNSPEDLRKIGMPGEKDFVVDRSKEKLVEYWSWWSMKKCEEMEVRIKGTNDSRISSSFSRREVPWTIQTLAAALKAKGIDTSRYGQGQAKSLEDFAKELQTGVCNILENDKSVLRMVDIVVMKLVSIDGTILVETAEVLGDNRQRARNVLPGAKRKANEDVRATAKRILSELSIEIESVDMQLGEEMWDEKESPSYPQVKSVYRKQVVHAIMLSATDKVKAHGAGVQQSMHKRHSA